MQLLPRLARSDIPVLSQVFNSITSSLKFFFTTTQIHEEHVVGFCDISSARCQAGGGHSIENLSKTHLAHKVPPYSLEPCTGQERHCFELYHVAQNFRVVDDFRQEHISQFFLVRFPFRASSRLGLSVWWNFIVSSWRMSFLFLYPPLFTVSFPPLFPCSLIFFFLLPALAKCTRSLFVSEWSLRYGCVTHACCLQVDSSSHLHIHLVM